MADAVHYDPYLWETAHDPYPIYRRLREEAPVYRNDERDFWALSRHADVLAAHLDPATFASSGGVTIEGYEKDSPFLIVQDPPQHTWSRKIVARVFTPRRIADLEPYIRTRCGEVLDPHLDHDRFDAVEDFAVQIPLDVIGELVGIPVELRPEVHRLSDLVIGRSEDDDGTGAVQAEGTLGLVELFLGLVEDRRAHRRDDVITLLLETEVTDDEGTTRRLGDEEVAFRFLELAFAGHETVAKLLPNGLVALDWFRDARTALIADPTRTRAAVEELLRWDAPSHYQGRTTTRPVELHGTTIPAGEKVVLVTGSANHDERVYAEPELFSIDRTFDHPVTFGFGIHVCLGAHLARLEARIMLEEFLARFPSYAIDGSGAVRHAQANVRGLAHLPVETAA